MLVLLHGSDALAVRRRLDALKDEADGGTGMLTTNYLAIEGRDAKVDDILGPAMTPPFLSPKRLVVVEGFLDRWAPREDGRAVRGVDAFGDLFTALEAGLPESTILVFTGGGGGRAANPMVDRLRRIPGAADERHDEPQRDELLRYIRDEAAARGIRLRNAPASAAHYESDEWLHRQSSDPAAVLAGITNGNTLALASELDKLALYTLWRDATVDDVYAICSGEKTINEFALIDSTTDGKLTEALDALQKSWRDAATGQGIFGRLASRYSQLAVIAEQVEAGASAEEIGRSMGNAGRYPGLRDAAIRRARRHGLRGVRAALAAIADADFRLKKGEVKHEEALVEVLVIKLARIATGRP